MRYYKGATFFLDNFEVFKEKFLMVMTSGEVSRRVIDAEPLDYQELLTKALEAKHPNGVKSYIEMANVARQSISENTAKWVNEGY